MDGYTKEERVEVLNRMRRAKDNFYAAALGTGVHAFVEFAGWMHEYILICEASGTFDEPLLADHNVAYLAEKLDCIYGPALRKHGLLDVLLR